MKKIRFIISIIYISLIILVSSITIFYLVKTIKNGVDIYFSQENEIHRTSVSLNTEDLINKIDLLIKIKAFEE